VFWRTGCVGCGRICGGRRRHSEPEASPEATRQGRSGCPPSTAEVAGKTAVEVATRTAKAGPGQVGGGAGAGRAKTKTPAVESEVPVTATRHCPVPVLCRSAKTSFSGRGPLRCASRLLPPGSRKVAGPVSALPVPAPSRCAGAGPLRRLGLRDRRSSDTAHQHTQQDGRAAPATPATGLRRPFLKTKTQEESAETRCRRCRSYCVLASSPALGPEPARHPTGEAHSARGLTRLTN